MLYTVTSDYYTSKFLEQLGEIMGREWQYVLCFVLISWAVGYL